MSAFAHDSAFNRAKSFNKVRFGKSALLETELNELQDIQNHLRASLIRKLTPSGIVFPGTWVATNTPGQGSFGNNGAVNNLIYLGPNAAILYGQEVPLLGPSDKEISVSLPAKPGSGTRTDLLFLEVWFELVTPLSTINKHGGVQSGTLPNDLIDARMTVETSWRVQLKWRYRVVSGVNFTTYPNGVSDPSVKARGAKASDTLLTFSASTEDSRLFIAGSAGDKATLGTDDGFSYALPILKITRSFDKDIVGSADISDIRPAISMNFTEHVQSSGHVHIGTNPPPNNKYLWLDTST